MLRVRHPRAEKQEKAERAEIVGPGKLGRSMLRPYNVVLLSLKGCPARAG
jgi:hypothetical protein